MKRRHFRSKVIIGIIVFVLCFTYTVLPIFASPSLEDATVSYAVKGYYSQYVDTFSSLGVSLTRGICHSSGQIETTSNNYWYTSKIPVVGGQYFTIIYLSTMVPRSINNVTFYDSNDNVLAGFGYDYSGTGSRQAYFSIPYLASYVVITEITSSYASNFGILTSMYELTSSNYQYLYHEIDSINIVDNKITIPYQAYTYKFVFIDFLFFSSNYALQSFSLDVYAYIDSPHLEGVSPLTYRDGEYLTVYRFFNDSNGNLDFSFIEDSSSNPSHITPYWNDHYERPFRGFRMYLPILTDNTIGSVSSSLNVELSNFKLNGYDIEWSASQQALITEFHNKLNNYNSLIPSTEEWDEFINWSMTSVHDDSDYRLILSSIYDFSAYIPTLILMSISVAFLGYIAFGKKG